MSLTTISDPTQDLPEVKLFNSPYRLIKLPYKKDGFLLLEFSEFIISFKWNDSVIIPEKIENQISWKAHANNVLYPSTESHYLPPDLFHAGNIKKCFIEWTNPMGDCGRWENLTIFVIPQSIAESQRLSEKKLTIDDLQNEPSKSQYSLTKGLDLWSLIFDKQETVLKNEKGLLYIDYLLHNPNKDPIKAIELNSLISKFDCKNGKYYEQSDEYGNLSVIDKNSVVSEGNLDSEERKVGIQLWKKRRSLESELEGQNLNEMEKNEIQEELKKIQKTLDGKLPQISSNYQKVTKAVQVAIRRLQDNLSKSTTSDNRTPHQILRNFSQHIETHILNPSSRLKGSYVYTPPNGINWE